MERVKALLEGKEPVKWLFYGDSITHGALHTFGMRDYAELFSERVRFEMGRTQDIVLNTAISGVRLVKAFGQEDYEIDRFDYQSGMFRDIGVQTGRTFAMVFPAIGVTMQLGTLLVLYFGGRQLLASLAAGAGAKGMSLGDLWIFIGMMGAFYGPFIQLLHTSRWATRSLTAAQRIFDILDTEPDHIEEDARTPMPDPQGRVTFENVTFGYEPLKPVLKDIDLDIAPGEMIGLVGPSGGGKSTLLHLLLRFYDPTAGAVLVDGHNIAHLRKQSLRRHIGIVSQEPFLFRMSVGENIRYGKLDATDEEIHEALRQANAYDFVAAMPLGLETVVGERGVKLSGGQRQRLCIARAFIENPRILLLDEATASVEPESEMLIQSALQRLMQGRTTVIVSHRLSMIRGADRIFVIQDGRIAETGDHDFLMRLDGWYARMYRMQTEDAPLAQG